MGLYGFLSRVWKRSSYSIKILLAAILGTHSLLGSAFVWVAPATFDPKIGLALIVLERSVTFGLTVWLIWSLLSPVRATTAFLEEYIRTGRITELPTDYPDEAGRLMAHTRFVVTELNRTVEELARTSATDPLTGLPNRRFATGRLSTDAETLREGGGSAVLAMIDLDNLKEINDNQGHAAGDECLKKIAQALKATANDSDWSARWGGDEFVSMLWHVDQEGATEHLETIRRDLETEGISFSFGLTDLGENVESSIEAADAALYRAKRDRKHSSSAVKVALS